MTHMRRDTHETCHTFVLSKGGVKLVDAAWMCMSNIRRYGQVTESRLMARQKDVRVLTTCHGAWMYASMCQTTRQLDDRDRDRD